MSHNLALAVDVGGSHVRYGVVGPGRVHLSEAFDTDAAVGIRSLLGSLTPRLAALLDRYTGVRGHVKGIGVSFPGLVDSTSARVTWTPRNKFDDAQAFDFRRWASDSLNLPVALENDANMALLGEWQFGAGRGCLDLVQLTLGTGVGSAALMDGRLVRGKHFQAGCLGGFQIVNFDGTERANGYRGYAECEASTWALPELVRSDPEFEASSLSRAETLDYETLFAHASDVSDPVARRQLDRSILVWGSVVVNLIHAYDPERVILSGGLLRSEDRILEPIREVVSDLAHTPWGEVTISRAENIEDAAMFGAWYAVDALCT